MERKTREKRKRKKKSRRNKSRWKKENRGEARRRDDSNGEINQHNNKLYKRIIGNGNKFPQTCKNLWGTPIKYKVQNRN